MQAFIDNKVFKEFNNHLYFFNDAINQFEQENRSNIEEEYNLKQYDEKVNGSDEDILMTYEMKYDVLKEIINKKMKVINTVENMGKDLENVMKILLKEINKEKNDLNELKGCINQIIDKMINQHEEICIKDITNLFENGKEMNHYNQQQRTERNGLFDRKKKELLLLKLSQEKPSKRGFIHTLNSDKQLEKIGQSLYYLQQWSNKKNYSIIFDSKIDGDGSNDVLRKKILNKRNLYFIHFDNDNNVFGGYINEPILEKENGVNRDFKAFVFSLQQDNVIINQQFYYPQGFHSCNTLYLYSMKNVLYNFGGSDIVVYPINDNHSRCVPKSFDYSVEESLLEMVGFYTTKRCLKDSKDEFVINRIVILEMN
ncbi:TLDc domain-containing protein [Entamoeba marina]